MHEWEFTSKAQKIELSFQTFSERSASGSLSHIVHQKMSNAQFGCGGPTLAGREGKVLLLHPAHNAYILRALSCAAGAHGQAALPVHALLSL